MYYKQFKCLFVGVWCINLNLRIDELHFCVQIERTSEGMTLIANDLDILDAVNKCQVAELKKAGLELDPTTDSTEFFHRVRNVQSAVIHTYQLTAFASIREADPKQAAAKWKAMADFCEGALVVLRDLKKKYHACGTAELYDLALDYREQAQKRYYQNLQDSECQTIPAGLFPEMT